LSDARELELASPACGDLLLVCHPGDGPMPIISKKSEEQIPSRRAFPTDSYPSYEGGFYSEVRVEYCKNTIVYDDWPLIGLAYDQSLADPAPGVGPHLQIGVAQMKGGEVLQQFSLGGGRGRWQKSGR